MFLVKLLKSFIRLLCEFGFGGLGMNFKPFKSKVLSWSVRVVSYKSMIVLFVLIFDG